MRLVIEIGADGIVRVVDSTPITEHGHLQSATVDAQAKSETVVDSSYGENRETGPKLSGVQNQKNRVERTWLQMGSQGKGLAQANRSQRLPNVDTGGAS